MANKSVGTVLGMPAGRFRPTAWAAYAACAWAFAFAAQSFYYAAGGTAGVDTWPVVIVDPVRARDPTWIAIMWGTGIAKTAAGLFALILARTGAQSVPRRPVLTAAWGAGILLALYGAANMVQHAVMVAGFVGIPDGLGARSARWHLFLWDPYWVIGGVLFCAAARESQRFTRGGPRRPSR